MMLLIHRKYISFKVLLANEVKVSPYKVLPELKATSGAIAVSLTSLLRYHLRNSSNLDKESTAIKYLESYGYRVENAAS